MDDPKNGRSKGTVPVIKQVADGWGFHRLRRANARQQLGPLCLNNMLQRQILPALKHCENRGNPEGENGEAKHPFKLDKKFPKWRGRARRTWGLGSNRYALGVSVKAIPQIRRYANLSPTATYCIKTIPDQVTDAMEMLEQTLPGSISGNALLGQQKHLSPPSFSAVAGRSATRENRVSHACVIFRAADSAGPDRWRSRCRNPVTVAWH